MPCFVHCLVHKTCFLCYSAWPLSLVPSYPAYVCKTKKLTACLVSNRAISIPHLAVLTIAKADLLTGVYLTVRTSAISDNLSTHKRTMQLTMRDVGVVLNWICKSLYLFFFSTWPAFFLGSPLNLLATLLLARENDELARVIPIAFLEHTVGLVIWFWLNPLDRFPRDRERYITSMTAFACPSYILIISKGLPRSRGFSVPGYLRHMTFH